MNKNRHMESSRKLEARSTKQEAGSRKQEAGSSKHEVRSSKFEARSSELETRNSKLEARSPELGTRNPKPETRNPKPETRAEIAGPAAGGAALQGFMPSCYAGNEKTVTGREISLQDGKFSYRDAKKSRRTGDFVTGSTQNEAGPVTAGDWRMLMNDFRLVKNPQPAVSCHFDLDLSGEKSATAKPGNKRSLSAFGMTARNLEFETKDKTKIAGKLEAQIHRTPFASLKGAMAAGWNTPLGYEGSAGVRTYKIRFETNDKAKIAGKLEAQIHRTPFASLKGAMAAGWNTPLGDGGSTGVRTHKIRFETKDKTKIINKRATHNTQRATRNPEPNYKNINPYSFSCMEGTGTVANNFQKGLPMKHD